MRSFITFSRSKPQLPSVRHRGLIRVVLLTLFVASLGVDPYYQGAEAATSTTANLDGYKINTAGSRIGTFSTAKVSIKKATTGAVNSSTAQPFYLNALSATAAGDHYIVSISPTSVPGYTVKGLTWCLNSCTGFNQLASNFRPGSSTDFTLYAGNNYHIRWIFQPIAIQTPVPAPAKTPTPLPAPKPTPAPTTPAPSPSQPPGLSSTPSISPTPSLSAANDSSREITLTSDDHVAEVLIGAGAIGNQANCSLSGSSEDIKVSQVQTKAAGPYMLSCKTRLGEAINTFARPVMWTYHLKDHLGSNLVPKAFVIKPGGGKQEVPGAYYDKASQDFNFATASTGDTMVLASEEPPSIMTFGLVGLVVLLVGLAIGAPFFIRRPVKQSYEDYIRSKYYDL